MSVMRDEQAGLAGSGTAAWPDAPARPGQVVLESVDARSGGAATRRVFRGRLRNLGRTTAVVTLDVALPAPFLPGAPVLMQRLFTIAPGETLRVELGSTVGGVPSVEDVCEAVRLRVG